ncbi:hypothetical protein [Methylocystis sp. ATCC 49242]|uniref:hypothetical protein n=1 Tax=Methylocystis sp. ATCC 49242 TaxID=622637 RepID=UPI0001F8881A|nr:hypothetical protein [Methylocystis sp. ATCC 49242]
MTDTPRRNPSPWASQPTEVPEKPNEPTDNAPKKWADFNFKVDDDFRAFFAIEARMRRMSNIALLKTALKHYLDTYGSKADPERKIL